MRGASGLAMSTTLSLLATLPLAAGSAVALPNTVTFLSTTSADSFPPAVAGPAKTDQGRRLAVRDPALAGPVQNEGRLGTALEDPALDAKLLQSLVSDTPDLVRRNVGPGHCDEPDRDNDVTGTLKTCKCVPQSPGEAPSVIPDLKFVNKLKLQACEKLSTYTWGVGGAASALSYGLKAKPDRGLGMNRGMVRFAFNEGAEECGANGYRVNVSNDECQAAVDALMTGCDFGGHGLGHCMNITTNVRPIETQPVDWKAASWKEDETKRGGDWNSLRSRRLAARDCKDPSDLDECSGDEQPAEPTSAHDGSTTRYSDDDSVSRHDITPAATSLVKRKAKAGHCDQKHRDNDVKGDIKECKCVDWKEAGGGPPPRRFSRAVEETACGWLSGFTYGKNGDSAHTYALRRGGGLVDRGVLRGLVRLEFNDAAEECNDQSVKLSKDECLNGIREITKKCGDGAHGYGKCAVLRVNWHPEAVDTQYWNDADNKGDETDGSTPWEVTNDRNDRNQQNGGDQRRARSMTDGEDEIVEHSASNKQAPRSEEVASELIDEPQMVPRSAQTTSDPIDPIDGHVEDSIASAADGSTGSSDGNQPSTRDVTPATSALVPRKVEHGHCGDKNIKHDPSGETVHCRCYEDDYFEPRSQEWKDGIAKKGCEKLATFTYGDQGAASSVAIAYSGSSNGVSRDGMLRIKYNSEAEDCKNRHPTDVVHITPETCQSNFTRALEDCKSGGEGYGGCLIWEESFKANITHPEIWKNIPEECHLKENPPGPHKFTRDAPANGSNADRFFSGLGVGYCDEAGRRNDVAGDIKMCECLHERLYKGPDERFIDEFKGKAAEELSEYLYGDKGSTTNVTYGVMQHVPAAVTANEDGNIRGLLQFEYNSVAKECDRTAGDTFKLSISELKTAITAGLGTGIGQQKCDHGSIAWGKCLKITTSFHPERHNPDLWKNAKLKQLPERVTHLAVRDHNTSNDTSNAPNPPSVKPGYCPEPSVGDKNPAGNMFCCKKDLDKDTQIPDVEVVFGAIQDLCKQITKPGITYGRSGFAKKAETLYMQPNGIRAMMTIEYNTDATDCKGDNENPYDYGQCEALFKQAFAREDGECGPNGGVVYEKCKKFTLDVHPEVTRPNFDQLASNDEAVVTKY